MKINICIFILFLFAQSANAQINRSIELAGGDSILMLSDVQNGFTREVPFLHKENLSTFYGVAARVTNTGVSEFRIEGWLNTTKWCGSGIYVKPGESKTIQLFIYRSRPAGMIRKPFSIQGQEMLYSSDNKTKLEFINYLQQKYGSIGKSLNSFLKEFT